MKLTQEQVNLILERDKVIRDRMIARFETNADINKFQESSERLRELNSKLGLGV